MSTVSIAPNVQAAAVAAIIAPIVLHILAAYNIDVPQDAADAIPGILAVVVAHVWDICTGGNKAKV